MSRDRFLQALNLQMSDEIAQTELISNDEYLKKYLDADTSKFPSPSSKKTEINKYYGPANNNWLSEESWALRTRTNAHLGLDFSWITCERPVSGRITSMGHATWGNVEGENNEIYCPFETEQDVLNFDPITEYGLPDHKQTVQLFQQHLDTLRKIGPDVVIPGGRYNSLFSACIRTFGWEMFLVSVGYGYDKFDNVLEGFFKITQAEIAAWMETDMEVYLMHDDICWTTGPVFHPDWYKKYIFPRYKKLWKPLREKGVKVIYCADGDISMFVDDLVEAGANGLMFEPATPLEPIAEKYGKEIMMIGNTDCRILQFGTKEEIYNEVKRCAEIGKKYPGYVFSVSNHIPNGIPLENIEYYLECVNNMKKR